MLTSTSPQEAKAARQAFKTACDWCFQSVGCLEEYEVAATLRLEAYERMRDLGLLQGKWTHDRHERPMREDLIRVWKALGRF